MIENIKIVLACAFFTLLVGVVIGSYVYDRYCNWEDYTLRPIITAEVNKILCQRGLSWDCGNVSDSMQMEHDRRVQRREK